MWTETVIKLRYITDDNEYKINFIPSCRNVPHHQLIIKKGELSYTFPIDDDYENEIIVGEMTNIGTARLFNAELGEWIKLNVDYISLLIEVKNMTEYDKKQYAKREFIDRGGYNNIQ